MTIVTAVFDYKGKTAYERCIRALTASIRENMPGVNFRILRLDPPGQVSGAYQGWVNNHIKLSAYADFGIHGPTAFIDSDTLVLRDFSRFFTNDFDVAIGWRPTKARWNGGVVLFNDTDRARKFLKSWERVDEAMLYDQEFHMPYQVKYNGQNQASFGYMIENHLEMIRLKEYPCREINAVEQDWRKIKLGSYPYILHVRKRLFDEAHSEKPLVAIRREMRFPAGLWRSYETKYEQQKRDYAQG